MADEKRKDKGDRPLKAYQASDGDEDECIVFATTGVAARRMAANEMDCEFETVEYCRRAPQFDQYAPGPVPIQAMIDAGWWWTCAATSERIDSDCTGYVIDEARRLVFASPWARLDYFAERGAEEADKALSIRECLMVFPGASELNAYQTSDYDYDEKVWRCRRHVGFMFPGAKYGCHWAVGAETARLHADDVAAYRAWKAAGYPSEMPTISQSAAA